jgi:hypothetical protein
MKRATFILVAGLVLAAVAIPQDLPPGVVLLSKVKRHIKEELKRQSNVCCLQTVQREHQPPRGKMRPLDTVRLEVLFNGEKELFASPGDRKFSEDHPISYAGSGDLSNGFFGIHLKNILVVGEVSNEYKGEEVVGGRSLARYDYRQPLMWSGQMIQTREGSGRVGLHGSYWADPRTYDVIRLVLIAEDLPPSLPYTESVTSINYARTDLGNNSTLLLPESAELRMVKTSGEVSRSRIEFTHCRVFEAESVIAFAAPDSPPRTPGFGAALVDDTLRSLPAGLEIAVKLLSRISADTAVGTLIDGVVAANAPAKRAVVVPEGSPVRGRIRRLETYSDPFPHFIVALEFTEVESKGIRYRFFADPVEIESAPGVEFTLVVPGERIAVAARGFQHFVNRPGMTISFSNLPGVATFFCRGSRLNLPQGFRTVWKTRPLAP